jgi:hypothetical protein
MNGITAKNLARIKEVKHVNTDELKALWRVLERLQADLYSGHGWLWNEGEKQALMVVMDAVIDTANIGDEDLAGNRQPPPQR